MMMSAGAETKARSDCDCESEINIICYDWHLDLLDLKFQPFVDRLNGREKKTCWFHIMIDHDPADLYAIVKWNETNPREQNYPKLFCRKPNNQQDNSLQLIESNKVLLLLRAYVAWCVFSAVFLCFILLSFRSFDWRMISWVSFSHFDLPYTIDMLWRIGNLYVIPFVCLLVTSTFLMHLVRARAHAGLLCLI